ncbi:MAG: C39 family peptidase [Candidatus Gastranaerophilales bacterium]|nr:C39 family peptidase [Candidatus Gastranaerophilales bacterium]
MAFDVSKAYDVMKSLAQKVSGSEDVSRSDAKKMFKSADTDGDGILSLDEFKSFYMSTDDYQSLEEDYLEAFEAIAGLDGEEGLSEEDIESVSEEVKANEVDETQAANGAGSSGGGGGGGGGGNGGGSDKTNNDTQTGVKPVSLTGNETPAELREGRDDVLSSLQEAKNAKSEIKNSDAYKSAEDSYENADETYNESLDALVDIYNQKKEAGEQLTEQEENLVELEEEKDAITEEVNAQKETITNVETQISTAQENLSTVTASLEGLEEPSTSLIVPIYDEEGNVIGEDTSAYDAAMAAYEAQKAELEAQKAEIESNITDLESQLAEEETKLETLNEKVFTNDAAIAEALVALETAAQNSKEVDEAELKAIQASKQSSIDYLTAWQNLMTVETQLLQQNAADINQLRANLKTYDDALDKYDEEQNSNMPEGMSTKNGFVYEGEGEDAKLMLPVSATEEGYDLPEGYKINESDGTVVDENGNVVGKVVNTQSDAKGNDGVADDVQRVYLYADAVATSNDDTDTTDDPTYMMSTNSEDYNITKSEAEKAKAEFIDAYSSDDDSVKAILDAVGNGEISDSVAKYLLADITNGDTGKLMDYFGGDDSQSLDNEYVKQLNNMFSSIENAAENYKANISKSNSGSNKPAPTLEEFLASVDDPQAKKWYTQMFTELGYDYDTFWDTSDIPRDFQSVYTDAFATGTIRSAGCGITSLSMLSEYLTGEYKSPTELAGGYTGDNPATALERGLNATGVEWSRAFGSDAMSALDASLDAGKPVIINVRGSSAFTEGGHFMVVSGKTADGKYIVNDPNIENYLNPSMVDGFTNGFSREDIERGLSHVIVFNK